MLFERRSRRVAVQHRLVVPSKPAMMTLRELEQSLPWGLHDAYLERLDVDYAHTMAGLVARVMMSETQDLDQRARIEIRGLIYLCIEPPEAPAIEQGPDTTEGLWLDSVAMSPEALPSHL